MHVPAPETCNCSLNKTKLSVYLHLKHASLLQRFHNPGHLEKWAMLTLPKRNHARNTPCGDAQEQNQPTVRCTVNRAEPQPLARLFCTDTHYEL